jgi:hypothetical protein
MPVAPIRELALDRAFDFFGTRPALLSHTEYLAEPLQFGDGTLGTLQELNGVLGEVVRTSEDATRCSTRRAVWYGYVFPYGERSFKNFDTGSASLEPVRRVKVSVLAYG